jgi:exosome complex component RRP45
VQQAAFSEPPFLHFIWPRMPREADPSINEKAFVLQALAEGVRIDSRSLDAYRDIKIQFGREFGVADVQLGLTR